MESDNKRAEYLTTGSGDDEMDRGRLDLIRDLLRKPETWSDPPPEVGDSVTTAIGGETSGASHDVPHQRRIKWPLVAAVAVAAAFALVIGLTGDGNGQGQRETVVAVQGTELAPSVSGTIAVRPTESGWWIRLDVVDLPPAPEGSYYQGWVWNDSDGVSIGTFHMREAEEPVILWSGVSLDDYQRISVTLQQEGGGTDPSDQVMLRALLQGLGN